MASLKGAMKTVGVVTQKIFRTAMNIFLYRSVGISANLPQLAGVDRSVGWTSVHSATVPGTWYNLYCSTSTLVVEYCRAAVWYYDIYTV